MPRTNLGVPAPDEHALNPGGDVSPVPAPASKRAKPMKGRRKFTADLAKLSEHPELIPRSGQWSVKSVKPGDEDASLEIVLVDANESKRQTFVLVVSDSSCYPDEHTYIAYAPDAGALELDVTDVIDSVSTNLMGCTLQEAVNFFVEAISHGSNYEKDEEDEDEDADFMSFDEDLERLAHEDGTQTAQALSLDYLKKDCAEVKAAGYNPGILWMENDRFILSVSLPVSDLFQHIVPHALLAWDQHFLEPGLHLTLLISGFKGIYPVLQKDGTLSSALLRTGSTLKFKVGFTRSYKPSRKQAMAAFRELNLKASDKDDQEEDIVHGSDFGVFRKMSLSASLESLLDHQLLRLLQLRRKFNLGWAGAEELVWQSEMTQEDVTFVFQQKRQALETAELEEKKLSESNNLPSDPINVAGSEMNILKVSFVFLLRRLTLSTRHCVVCHKKLGTDEALRPYICTSELCAFQYYLLNLGPSIEHEIITNTGAVDLLISLAYVAAAEGVLDEPLPRGMGLRVRRPATAEVQVDEDGLCELDLLSLPHMRTAIAELLNSLPPVNEMKEYLQLQFSTGNTDARLRDIDPKVLPAAWSVLRWCVASCTAHIQELTKPEDRLRNLDNYRQFRFLVGAPDKEKKFSSALPQGTHLSVFASIPWFPPQELALDYPTRIVVQSNVEWPKSWERLTVWKNSMIKPTACCTLAEIVNRRQQFVYNGPPYFVVDKTEWIMCRYLLVQSMAEAEPNKVHLPPLADGLSDQQPREEAEVAKYLEQERNFSTRWGTTIIDVPQPSYQLDKLVKACISKREDITFDDEDRAIFDGPDKELSEPDEEPPGLDEELPVLDERLSDPRVNPPPTRDLNVIAKSVHVQPRPWVPDDEWIQRNATELLPPPTESSITASLALRREFKSMMHEQAIATEKNDLGTLGWYLPPQHNENNLYQWLVELHSFDPALPLAKDMKTRGVASIAMEVRFPPSFPHAPPFFRVIRPRFRPLAEGGGGHVTLGGSICMDLLTSDGWLPTYCVSSVLLQIKLAISATTPFPARLRDDWDRVYTPDEALKGYVRAANFHNWRIKNMEEIRKLVTAG